MNSPKLHFIHLKKVPILQQLQIEEALLRADDRNFCIVNYGSPKAIVMGISNQIDALLNKESIQKEGIPIIRRFSGGGTVIVDPNTIFISFIMGKQELEIPPFPEPILRWVADLCKDAWEIPGFQLKENDYCIGDLKCGGNAQYIRKDRWLHHTSFLWDYSEENMNHLRLPGKRPKYRLDRSHAEFLTKLKNYGKTPEQLIEQFKEAIVKRFYMEELDAGDLVQAEHRKSTQLLSL